MTGHPRVPRLKPPKPRRRVSPLKSWFGRVKRRAGYYDVRDGLRNRLLEPRFVRALRPSDVFLVGHPKSGNTWLAYMLAVFLADQRTGGESNNADDQPTADERANAEHDGSPARDDRAAGGGGSGVTLYNVGDYIPFIHGRDHDIARYSHLPSPRVFRNEYPRHLRRYPRTLYLVRDPRAVLVSFWHMYVTMFDDRTLTLSAFVDGYLHGTAPFDAWHRHLPRWDRQVTAALDRTAEADPSICVLRYEDLVRERNAALRQAVDFIAREPSPASPPVDPSSAVSEAPPRDSFERRLARAAASGSFDAMRTVEDRHGAEAYAGRALGAGRFIRRGRTDGWKDEMPPTVATRIESTFGPVMHRAGFPP